MTDNAAGTMSAACDSGGVYSGRGADCKWNNLLDVVTGPVGSTGQGFLAAIESAFSVNVNVSDPVQVGLSAFPGATISTSPTAQACATGDVLTAIGPGNSSSITTTLLSLAPAGGTPAAATLPVVGAALAAGGGPRRASYVILVTDGAPNCDSNLTATAANCTGDRCTLSSCAAADWDTNSCGCYNPSTGAALAEGCLDESAAVAAVASLYRSGIETFVVGFGADTVSSATAETLSEMGAAGVGLSTTGASHYIQTQSSQELQSALAQILAQMHP